jgi:hypothetical protein
MSSSKIIFSELKHMRNILINEPPVILELNIRKKIYYFLGSESRFFIMCWKEKILYDTVFCLFWRILGIETLEIAKGYSQKGTQEATNLIRFIKFELIQKIQTLLISYNCVVNFFS